MSRRTRSGLRLPLALLLILVLAACRRDGGPAPGAEEPVVMPPENVVIARIETLETGPYISGALRPRREAALRSELSSRVVAMYAEKGDAVRTGELLALLDARDLGAARRSALQAVGTAERAADFARTNVRRAEVLFGAGGVALRDVENARLELATAESQLAAARAQLATIEEQLADTEIRAPFAGRVAARHVSLGDVVQPGMDLFTVIDPGTMRLEAELPAEHLREVSVGAPVRFQVRGYPAITFDGTVSRIGPAADSLTRQIEIVVSIPNPTGELVADLFADGRVESEIRTGVVIPEDAVVETDLGPSVMAVRGGRAVRVEIRIGVRDERRRLVLVLAGLAAGDTVLVGAGSLISEGTPVVVQLSRSRTP